MKLWIILLLKNYLNVQNRNWFCTWTHVQLYLWILFCNCVWNWWGSSRINRTLNVNTWSYLFLWMLCWAERTSNNCVILECKTLSQWTMGLTIALLWAMHTNNFTINMVQRVRLLHTKSIPWTQPMHQLHHKYMQLNPVELCTPNIYVIVPSRIHLVE